MMAAAGDITDLETRAGLPDALRVLAETLPRDGWEAHPNFDGLTRFWMQRHMMFRELLTRLAAGAEARLDSGLDPERHAREVAHYGSMLLNQLHGHHQIEDHHYFPLLSGLDARLARGFGILEADHLALDRHLGGFADAANVYLRAWSGAQARDHVGAVLTQLRTLDRLLDRHLTDEEELVVPVVLTYAPEIDHMLPT